MNKLVVNNSKPQKVTHSIWLICIINFLGAINIGIVYLVSEQSPVEYSDIFTWIYSWAITITLAFLISFGKNWARKVYVVISILNLLIIILGFEELIKIHRYTAFSIVSIHFLNIPALFWLYSKESNDWFEMKRAESN